MLQSFGGDLINRNDYKTRRGRAERRRKAVEWATWFRGLVTDGLHAAEVRRRPGQGLHQRQDRDPLQRHVDGGRHPQGVRQGRRCSCRRRTSATARRSVAARGSGASSTELRRPGRRAGLHEVRRAGQVRRSGRQGHRRTSRPPTPPPRRSRATRRAGRTRSSSTTPRSSPCCGPSTPGYPFIATEFTKTAQDILNGADPQAGARPGRQGHRRQPEVQQLLPVS